jgi:hypothetical protein
LKRGSAVKNEYFFYIFGTIWGSKIAKYYLISNGMQRDSDKNLTGSVGKDV